MLAERPGEIIAREEIRGRLWPNGTLVEFEHSINEAIKKLRLALEDSASEPRYVETVKRRGYRLIVPVEYGPSRAFETVQRPEMPGGSFTGRRILHYRVLDIIGGGAMGLVYKAEDLKLGRSVALKFLPEELTKEPLAIERLRREARAASALNHPNICTIHATEEEAGHPFIAMELLDGDTLRDQIARGPLSIVETADFGIQIARALQAAHQQGIIHRDVKPSNIFITRERQVKILDFGVAKHLGGSAVLELDALSRADSGLDGDHSTSPGLTRTGATIGTAAYMSPEQIRGEKLDRRTDLFSFGLVLYEMAIGQHAFGEQTAAEVREAILVRTPATPPKAIDPDLWRIIYKALQKDCDLRYQTASEIRDELTNLRRKVGRRPKEGIRRWLILCAGVALLTLLAVVWRQSDKRTRSPFHVLRVTSYPGCETTPSLSPDGRRVAFSWNGDGGDKSHIYTKVVGENNSLRLTSDPRAEFSPAWSPDGRHIAFGRDGRDADEIVLIPASGGPERVIARLSKHEDPGHSERSLAPFDETGDPAAPILAWYPDGESLALVGRKHQDGPHVIFRLSVETGEMQALTFPDERSGGDYFPAISPDGQSLAFTRLPSRWIPPYPSLYVAALSAKAPAGQPKRLKTREDDGFAGIAWTSNSRRIVFASPRGLVSVGLDRGIAEPLSIPGYAPVFPTISGKGDRLAFVHFSEDLDIWRVDGPADTPRRAAPEAVPPTRLISSTVRDTNPQYSPDGARIAFTSSRGGTLQIWISGSDGSNPVQLTNFESPATPRWSPDGRFIAFDSPVAGRVGIHVVPTGGGPPRRITDTSSQNYMPSWSRDGKWIYFESDRSGVAQIWKAPFGDGAAVQVTHKGGGEAFESRDGKYVYYARTDRDGIWRVPAEGGDETLVIDRGSHFHWGLFDKGVCWINLGTAAGGKIDCLNFESNRTNTVSKLPTSMHVNEWGPSFSVSRDGRWILVAAAERRDGDIMLLDNFDLR
jgi:serine/threonine protein kinase